MSQENEKVLTRKQKKLEKEAKELSTELLKTSITISILEFILKDISKKKNIKLDLYLKTLKRELKKKENEFNKEYSTKKYKNQEVYYITSFKTTNEIFKNIVQDIVKISKEKDTDIKFYLKNKIKQEKHNFKMISEELINIKDQLKNKEEEYSDNDIDEKGNIKGLIAYSDDEDDCQTERDFKDYGRYVLNLKGKKLEEFVSQKMKNQTKEFENKYNEEDVDYNTEEDEDYNTEEDEDYNTEEDEDYNTEEEEDYTEGEEVYNTEEEEDEEYDSDYNSDEEILYEILGNDNWGEKELTYLKLRRQNENEIKKDIKYFKDLEDKDKDDTIELIEKLNQMNNQHKPLLFKIIESNMSINNKANVIKKLEGVENSDSHGHENYKLKSWIEGLLNIPFGVYKRENISKKSNKKEIKKYLQKCKKILDKAVFGHEEPKRHILQILSQNINNDNSKGNVFGIQGPMGNGKTTLVENGIAKSLNRPFSFISLGGATDSSFLEGHSYTYEGSVWGKIVDVLMKSGCMNPIIYFDELDKVSETAKGEEIINVLMHLTDPSQNNHFHDKYFQGIDFDLSKAIIVFSYNDIHKINPILKDRIVNIETKGFKIEDKIKIANGYLLPNIVKDIGINKKDIKIDESNLYHIIDTYTCEGGVRKFKEILYEIFREINLREMTEEKLLDKIVKYPLDITDKILKSLLYNKYEYKIDKINEKPEVGIVQGLYASVNCTGGLTRIESLFIPTSEKLGLELTGQQGDVMKESMKVAKSVAWSLIPEKIKEEYQLKWKNGNTGIHIHCPEGATPKDGPSAGAAITTVIVSLLTGVAIKHDVAMTGEINLNGKVMEIGGLENKIYGAKKAGVKTVLIPKDNTKDYQKIIKENPNLIEKGKFEVKIVSDIFQVLDVALVKNNVIQRKKNHVSIKKTPNTISY